MPLAARPNRRRLLAALHRQIALGGLGLLCVLGGVFTRSVMLVSAGMLLALIAGIRIGRLARCPHCGASLRGALAKALPLAQSDRPGEGLQVLRLRDVLASGADLQCSACGRELDDPPPPTR
ncbi:MAG: hypothetical protein KatS3mg121_0798 [Gammaproteobacteria bacterium]|nr:MAG: hypothetical protein KatS3mg121_0798 [Gammaproteobacteria bacterium]